MSISINAPVPMGVANKLPIGCTQTQDETPYLFRKSGGSNNANVGNRLLLNKIVGGTVAWNQRVNFARGSTTVYGLTLTQSEDKHSVTISGTANNSGNIGLLSVTSPGTANHIYLASIGTAGITGAVINFGGSSGSSGDSCRMYKPSTDTALGINLNVTNGTAINMTVYPQIFDLTVMFGSAIADYAYTLESGTSGAGIAWLKSYGFFTKPYYPYKAAALESVKTSAHRTVGFNQWDEEWEVGILNSSGAAADGSNAIRSKNYCRCVPSTVYYVRSSKTDGSSQNRYYVKIAWYDADKNFISGSWENNRTITSPDNAAYFKICTNTSTVVYGNTYNNDICINLSKTTGYPQNGHYEPYSEHSYAFDDVELRGILKKDANNNLYYDGDEYTADGTVTRKYGIIDLGTLDWIYSSGRMNYNTALSDAKAPTANYSPITGICAMYPILSANSELDKHIAMNTSKQLRVYDSAYTNAATFKTAMSGVYLVYELATPTTESADPYEKMQIVSKDGTEQFVDAGERDFEMPVQHETVYPIPTFAEETFDAFPMSVEESGTTQYPMEVTSQSIVAN